MLMTLKINPTPKHVRIFWNRVNVGEPDQCWNWTGRFHYTGYGEIEVFGTKKAHRVSWTVTFGEIPDGLFVCHKCDNRKCCNPYHLFLGTNDDNMKDMAKKGRSHRPKGEKNHFAKLTSEQVVHIRNLYEEGLTYVQISKMFGVCRSTIGGIITNKVWK